MLAKRILLGLILCGVCAYGARGQKPSGSARLDVVITEAAGKPVTNLSREAFRLFEDGESREIQGFSPADAPWNFVLLFDTGLVWLPADSPALAYNNASAIWRRMGQSIDQFLARLRAQDRVAIGAFENKVTTLLDWRNGKTGRSQTITFNPAANGGDGVKDLHGAIGWAIEKLRSAPGRKAVIILTDGRDGRLAPQWLVNDDKQEVFDPFFGLMDTAEVEEFEKILQAIRASDTRLFFLAVNTTRLPDFRGRPISGFYPGAKEAAADYLKRARLRLESMAAESGGKVLFGRAPEDALASYEKLHDLLYLDSRYTLEYTAKMLTEDDLPPRLEVRLNAPGLKPNFQQPTR